jgi:hypothetical protein
MVNYQWKIIGLADKAIVVLQHRRLLFSRTLFFIGRYLL